MGRSSENPDYYKIPVLLEMLKRFGGSFVPGWFMRDVVKSLSDDENHRTVWRDLVADLSGSPAKNPTTDPSWSTFAGSISAWQFPHTKMTELFISFHINHDIKPGSKIYPHIHWAPTGTGSGTVRWGIEYTIAKGHNQEAFPSPTTLYLEQASPEIAGQHMIVETADNAAIDAPEIDSLVICRVFRDPLHANDTLASGAFGLFVDMHFQADKTGSINKAPNFYREDYEA